MNAGILPYLTLNIAVALTSFHRLPNPKSVTVRQSNRQTNKSEGDCAVFVQEQPLDGDVDSPFELSTENRDARDFGEEFDFQKCQL